MIYWRRFLFRRFRHYGSRLSNSSLDTESIRFVAAANRSYGVRGRANSDPRIVSPPSTLASLVRPTVAQGAFRLWGGGLLIAGGWMLWLVAASPVTAQQPPAPLLKGGVGDSYIVVGITKFNADTYDVKLKNPRTGYVHSVTIYVDIIISLNLAIGDRVKERREGGQVILTREGGAPPQRPPSTPTPPAAPPSPTAALPPDPKANTVVSDGRGGLAYQQGSPDSNPYIREGIKRHEQRHMGDLSRLNPKAAQGVPAGYRITFSNTRQRWQSEVDAHRIEIAYLQQAKTQVVFDFETSAQIIARIPVLQNNLKIYQGLLNGTPGVSESQIQL